MLVSNAWWNINLCVINVGKVKAKGVVASGYVTERCCESVNEGTRVADVTNT